MERKAPEFGGETGVLGFGGTLGGNEESIFEGGGGGGLEDNGGDNEVGGGGVEIGVGFVMDG